MQAVGLPFRSFGNHVSYTTLDHFTYIPFARPWHRILINLRSPFHAVVPSVLYALTSKCYYDTLNQNNYRLAAPII